MNVSLSDWLPVIVDVPDETFRDPQSRLEITERDKFLHAQTEALPATYRMLVSLRFQEELSHEEISQLLNLPLGAVKTGIFRARAQLRHALRQIYLLVARGWID